MPIEIPRARLPADLLVSDDCDRLVRHFESFRPVAYKCPAGIWTVGYGFTEGVHPGDTITIAEASRRLKIELEDHAQVVREAIPDTPLTQGQFNALVSYVFNIGHILETLLAKLKARDMAGALLEFPRACRAEGKPLKGLYRRRLAESCMWSGLPWEGATAPHLIQLTSDAQGFIDFSRTTTLEEVLERARQDISTTQIRNTYPTAPPIIPSPPSSGPPPIVQAPEPAPVKVEPAPVEPPPVEPPKPKPDPAPAKPPPPPPPSIDQQTAAVNASARGDDWVSPKSMLLSRRFWGLFLIIAGRLAMTWTGSTAMLKGASDPIISELVTGFAVMCVGEALNKWGEVKAKRPLK
jgi:lysozyme